MWPQKFVRMTAWVIFVTQKSLIEWLHEYSQWPKKFVRLTAWVIFVTQKVCENNCMSDPCDPKSLWEWLHEWSLRPNWWLTCSWPDPAWSKSVPPKQPADLPGSATDGEHHLFTSEQMYTETHKHRKTNENQPTLQNDSTQHNATKNNTKRTQGNAILVMCKPTMVLRTWWLSLNKKSKGVSLSTRRAKGFSLNKKSKGFLSQQEEQRGFSLNKKSKGFLSQQEEQRGFSLNKKSKGVSLSTRTAKGFSLNKKSKGVSLSTRTAKGFSLNKKSKGFLSQQEQQRVFSLNKKSKCSNNPYTKYQQDFFTVTCPYIIQPSWTFELLHATLQLNECTSSCLPITLWPWINIKVIKTGIELLYLAPCHVWNKSIHSVPTLEDVKSHTL